MKKYQKCLIGLGAVFATGALIGAPIAASIITKNQSQSNIYVPPPSNHSDIIFNDNLATYQNIFQQNYTPTPQIFNSPENSAIQPWLQLPTQADDVLYQSIYEQLDIHHLTTDLLSFLTQIWKRQNDNFKFRVVNFGGDINFDAYLQPQHPAPQLQTYDPSRVYHLEVNVEVFNPTPVNKIYYLNNADGTLHTAFLESQQISQQSIIINSPIYPEFTIVPNGNGLADYHVNYYFKNVQWIIDGQTITIPKFAFNNYSSSLNTIVQNVSDKKNYLQYTEEGNAALSSLTIDDITTDITNSFQEIFTTVEKCLAPAQSILQSIARNDTLETFLSTQGLNIGILVDEILKTQNIVIPNIDLLIQAILKDKTIFEILHDETFWNGILDFVKQLLPNNDIVDMVAGFLSGVPDNKDEFDAMVDGLIEQVNNLVPDMDLGFLANLKDQGLLRFITSNIEPIQTILQSFINDPLINNILMLISPQAMTTGVLDLLVNDILKKQNPTTNSFVLLDILTTVIPNPTILDILQQLLFDNKNLTAKSLGEFIGMIANPTDDKKQVLNYLDIWKAMTTHPQFMTTSNSNQYDPNTHRLDFEIAYQFQFPTNIKYDLTKIWKLLPNNFTIPGGGNIPAIGLIVSLLPRTLNFFQNDAFTLRLQMHNELLKYNIVPNSQTKTNMLSWQALANFQYDTSLPKTVENLWHQAPPGGGDAFKKVFGNILFHQFNDYRYYLPSSSKKLNAIVIDNQYDAYQKNNLAIFTKPLTTERQTALKEAITNATQNVNGSKNYEWKYWPKTHTIYQTETQNTFDVNSILDELVDLTHFPNEYRQYLQVKLNSNLIIPEFSISIIKIPVNVIVNRIDITLPFNVYSNDGMMTNHWSFNF